MFRLLAISVLPMYSTTVLNKSSYMSFYVRNKLTKRSKNIKELSNMFYMSNLSTPLSSTRGTLLEAGPRSKTGAEIPKMLLATGLAHFEHPAPELKDPRGMQAKTWGTQTAL